MWHCTHTHTRFKCTQIQIHRVQAYFHTQASHTPMYNTYIHKFFKHSCTNRERFHIQMSTNRLQIYMYMHLSTLDLYFYNVYHLPETWKILLLRRNEAPWSITESWFLTNPGLILGNCVAMLLSLAPNLPFFNSVWDLSACQNFWQII